MAVPLPNDSSNAAFSWFTEYQRSCILENGIVPEWFHGIISRKAAEEMLMCKPPGYFLVRVSESRVGYTLSYRAEDRCRHFMINVLPDNQFIIVGEKMVYCSLHDLVAFHRRCPILPYNELLTVACEQGGKINYVELLFPQKKDLSHRQVEWISSSTETNTLQSNISEENQTSQLQNNSTSHPARLYPSLETEVCALNIQSMNQPTKPVPKPRTVFASKTPTEETPPQLPPRMRLPSRLQTTTEDRSQGLMPVNPDRQQITPNTPSEGRTQQKNQQQKPVVLSLVHIKKKLKKKRSEDHTYEEITGGLFQKDATSALESSNTNVEGLVENDYQELAEHPISDGLPKSSDGNLPSEYRHPPPFAPGY